MLETMIAKHSVVDHLNDLLTYLHDSKKGYEESVRVIKSESLKPILSQAARERDEMIHDLEIKVQRFGDEPTDHGSMVGPAHRLYLDFKALVLNGNKDAILNEIKRGENTLINTYKGVLRETLPQDLDETLHVQLDHIQDTIKELDRASI
jgi:uncharacterized protein (TIGR02284 family)